MRRGVALFALLLNVAGYGYPSTNFLFPSTSLEDVRRRELPKDSALSLVADSKVFKGCWTPNQVRKDTTCHFWSADLDGDTKNELIYTGQICAEGTWTVIWRQSPAGLRQRALLMGSIDGVKNTGADTTYISTLAPGCCASDCDYAHLYRTREDTAEIRKTVTMFCTIELPAKGSLRKTILIKNPLYSLRAQAVTNDMPDSFDVDRYGVLWGQRDLRIARGHEGGCHGLSPRHNGKNVVVCRA